MEFKGRITYPHSTHDDRFGFIGDAHSGTMHCMACGWEQYVQTHKFEVVADAHWEQAGHTLIMLGEPVPFL